MGKWDEKAQRDAVQSGEGPGEFGPDYSDRKRYQLGYGNESPSPMLKDFLVNTHRNPRESPYPSHVIEDIMLMNILNELAQLLLQRRR